MYVYNWFKIGKLKLNTNDGDNFKLFIKYFLIIYFKIKKFNLTNFFPMRRFQNNLDNSQTQSIINKIRRSLLMKNAAVIFHDSPCREFTSPTQRSSIGVRCGGNGSKYLPKGGTTKA